MKCVCPRPGVSSDSQFGVRGRLTVYRGPGFLAAVRVLSTCHEDEEPKQPSGATPPQILALNHHVPWDSSLSHLTFMIFMNPSAGGGHHLYSPSPGLVAELKVMSAEMAEIQGRTNTLQRSRREAATAHSLYYRI